MLRHSGSGSAAVLPVLPSPRGKALSLRERAQLASALAEEEAAELAARQARDAEDQATAETLLRLWGGCAEHTSGGSDRGDACSPTRMRLCFSAFVAMLAGVIALEVRPAKSVVQQARPNVIICAADASGACIASLPLLSAWFDGIASSVAS